MQEQENDNKVTIDVDVLEAKIFIFFTSTVLFTMICTAGCMSSIHRAPPFVRNQVFLIGVCNLAGILFPLSAMQNIYESKWNFARHWTFMTAYYGMNMLSKYAFSYQYLITSRTLSLEVNRKRSLYQDNSSGVNLLR